MTPLLCQKAKKTKESLDKVKVESGKFGLKLNIQKIKIMASGPITSWPIDGETVKTLTHLFSWAPKSLQIVIAAMKCPFERKAMTNLDSIVKRRDITLLTKVLLVKDMFFPIVTYGCESWIIKKAEH